MLYVCDGTPLWNCEAQLLALFSYFQFEGFIFISVRFSEYEFPLKEFQETPSAYESLNDPPWYKPSRLERRQSFNHQAPLNQSEQFLLLKLLSTSFVVKDLLLK